MTPDRIKEIEDLIGRLEAPEYWMSGSKDGHEGENDRPREAASALRELLGFIEENAPFPRSMDIAPSGLVLLYGKWHGEIHNDISDGSWAVASLPSMHLQHTDAYSVWCSEPLAWMPLPAPPLEEGDR